MTHDERTQLLQQLAALERKSNNVQRELRNFRERLLRYEAEVEEEVVEEVAEQAVQEVPVSPAPPRPTEPAEVEVEIPSAPPSAVDGRAVAAASEERQKTYADLEFWLGGRGLLLLGLTALVLAVSFFVKEAIERGWLGPLVRVLLGAAVGVVAVVAGERIRALGYRTYGLWLAAGGFTAIYLSVWAAAALYLLVSTPVAFALMAIVVVSAAALGLLRDSESFVALAALGGYLAPLLLRAEAASNLLSLGYLGLLSGAALWVAYRGSWRYLASLAVVGGTLLPVANSGDPHLHGGYLVALVVAALVVSRVRRWHEVALLAMAFGWVALGGGIGEWDMSGPALVGYAAAIAAAGFWVAYQDDWPFLAGLAVLGGTLLPSASTGAPHLHGTYLVALIAAALTISRLRKWHYVSLVTVALGWIALWGGSVEWGIVGTAFAVYAAALWLADLIASVGVTAWTSEAIREAGEAGGAGTDRPALAVEPDAFLRGLEDLTGLALTLVPPWVFFAFAMVGLEDSVFHESRDLIGSALAIVLGCVYVAQSIWSRPGYRAASRDWSAALGCAFWLAAAAVLWEGVGLARAWLLEGMVLTAAGVAFKHIIVRGSGLAAFALAVGTYWYTVHLRPEADPAIISGWALTGLAACLGLAAWALATLFVERSESWEKEVRPFLFLASAVFFLALGTVEILRFYDLLGEPERWALARDLSISSFWMVYAALLLSLGFWLKQEAIRWIGLGMALIAAGKVFLYDLSQLSELYRIASFVLLAVVLLALSFGYQRWRRASTD